LKALLTKSCAECAAARPIDQIAEILGVPEVDAAIDVVGFEARGHGGDSDHEAPATVLNSSTDVTRTAGKLGIPGSTSPATEEPSMTTPKRLAPGPDRPRLGKVTFPRHWPVPVTPDHQA
jgi:threonine dehydrogenase-like Zn-dependent dehydrogenase